MSTFEGPTVATHSVNGKPHPGSSNLATALRSAWDDWMDDARCLDADPNAFFVEKGGTTEPAKQICNDCDVREQCLEFALATPVNEDFGVWGGTSERERRRIRALRQLQAEHADTTDTESAKPDRRTNPERDAAITAAVDNGVEPARVARRYGITRRSVYRAIARHRARTDQQEAS